MAETPDSNINRSTSTVYQAKVSLDKSVLPPITFFEIHERKHAELWHCAYQKELDALETAGRMEVIDRLLNESIVPLLELFNWKTENLPGSRNTNIRIVALHQTR